MEKQAAINIYEKQTFTSLSDVHDKIAGQKLHFGS